MIRRGAALAEPFRTTGPCRWGSSPLTSGSDHPSGREGHVSLHQGVKDGSSHYCELFPLPVIESEPVPRSSLSRGTRQRVNKRRHADAVFVSVCDSLNWLSGTGYRESSCVDADLQREAVSSFKSLVLAQQDSDEAIRALFGSVAGYSETTSLRTYVNGNVSLRNSNVRAPHVEDLIKAEDGTYLEQFSTLVLRQGAGSTIEPYMDPVLRRSTGTYVRFLKDLHLRVLLIFFDHRHEAVTIFFVAKKSGKRRMIIDAMRLNERRHTPPSTWLATPEAIACVEAGAEGEVFFSKCDVQDCFYRLRISDDISKYFGLPSVSTSQFREITGHRWCGGEDSTPIFPCLGVSPWAFPGRCTLLKAQFQIVFRLV